MINVDKDKFTTEELINIEKIEARFGQDYHMTTKHNMAYNCPFCPDIRGKEDTDHKFMVDCKTTLFFCFKCETKGAVARQTITNQEKVIPFLFDYFNTSNNNEQESITDNELILLDDVEDIRKDSIAYDYLKNERNITDEQIDFYNIKNGIGEKLGRIIIPNLYIVKWTDYYQGRSYINLEPKYLNPIDIDKSRIVFNLQNQKKKQDRVYIVEGSFSAIRAGKDVVCTYGCNVSDYQINLLNSYKFKEYICCYDGDSAGQIGNRVLANALNKRGNNVSVVKLPETEDPADLGEERFKEYVEKHKVPFYGNKIYDILSYFD